MLHFFIYLQHTNDLIWNDKLMYKRIGKVAHPLTATKYHLPQLCWIGFNYEERNNLTSINAYIEKMVKKQVLWRGHTAPKPPSVG